MLLLLYIYLTHSTVKSEELSRIILEIQNLRLYESGFNNTDYISFKYREKGHK
jgi:hypothetical protein